MLQKDLNQRIYFFKHGAPDVIDGNFYESELSPEFTEKTLAIATSGEIPYLDMIYCSDYPRAIGCGKVFQDHYSIPMIVTPIVTNWRLQTLNSPNYVIEEKRGWKNRDLIVEGGESLNDVRDRVVGFVDSLPATSHKGILVMSHGITTELISAHYGKRVSSLVNKEKIRSLDYSILEYVGGSYVLVKDALSAQPQEDSFA